jgi:cytochrome b
MRKIYEWLLILALLLGVYIAEYRGKIHYDTGFICTMLLFIAAILTDIKQKMNGK